MRFARVADFIDSFNAGARDTLLANDEQYRGDYAHLPTKTQLTIGALGPLTLGMAYATPQFKEYIMIERAKARHRRRHPELY